MKKIRAFTIIELVVAMLLNSIIISIVYFVYRNCENFCRNSSMDYAKTTELIQLRSLLRNDCIDVLYGYFNNNELKFEKRDHQIIKYIFAEDKIVRVSDLLTDTFKMGKINLDVSFLFEKTPYPEEINLRFENPGVGYQHCIFLVEYGNKSRLEIASDIKINSPIYGY